MNQTVFDPSPWSRVCASGMLDSGVRPRGTRSAHVKVHLRAGSSQHGKHRRASMASNCDDTILALSPLMSVYLERRGV